MKKASHIYRWALRKQRALAGRSGSSKKGSMGLLGASGTPVAVRAFNRPKSMALFRGALFHESHAGEQFQIFNPAILRASEGIPHGQEGQNVALAFPSRRERTKQRLIFWQVTQGVHSE